MQIDPNMRKGTFVDWLQMNFLELEPTQVTAELEVRPEMMQPWQILSGGVLMSFADFIASAGVIRSLEEGYGFSSIELKMNFIKAVRNGKITGKGRCLHTGKSTSVWEVEIYDDKNQLAAMATTSIMILPPKNRT